MLVVTHQIFDGDRIVVRQPHSQSGHLNSRVLHVKRIKIDRDQNHVDAGQVAVCRKAALDRYAPDRNADRDGFEALGCVRRIRLNWRDFRHDVAGRIITANPDLIFFRVKIFFPARQRRRLANLET